MGCGIERGPSNPTDRDGLTFLPRDSSDWCHTTAHLPTPLPIHCPPHISLSPTTLQDSPPSPLSAQPSSCLPILLPTPTPHPVCLPVLPLA